MLRISEVTLIGMAGVMAVSLSLRQDIPVFSAGVNAPHAASFCAWVELILSKTCAQTSVKGGAVNAGTGQAVTTTVPVAWLEHFPPSQVAVTVCVPPTEGAVTRKSNLLFGPPVTPEGGLNVSVPASGGALVVSVTAMPLFAAAPSITCA